MCPIRVCNSSYTSTTANFLARSSWCTRDRETPRSRAARVTETPITPSRFGVAPNSLTMLTQSFTLSVLAIEPPGIPPVKSRRFCIHMQRDNLYNVD